MYCIYKLTNNKTNKFYIGQTNNMNRRINSHLSTLRNNTHHNSYLQRSFNKHGEECFEFSILHNNLSKEDANKIEEELIELYYDSKKLYNISKKSSGGDLISYHPNRDEIVKKVSEGGKRRWETIPDEVREVYRLRATGSNNYMYGKTHTPEARLKISKAVKGRIVGEEERARMSERMKKRYQNQEEVDKARNRMIDRYKKLEEREHTARKTLEVNLAKRESGEFQDYTYIKHDDEYEFIFKGKYYYGIKSCVEDTGYHPKYIKKKLLSEKEIDIMNYLIYDPIEKLITMGGNKGNSVKHSEETKRKIRESNLVHKRSNIILYLPEGITHNFEHNFELIEFLSGFKMKPRTIANLLRTGEEWNPKKYIHRHLKGLKIIKQPLTANA